MKADDDNAQVRMSGRVNSVGWVTDMGGGLSGHGTDVGGGLLGCGNMWRWGDSDVSSARCNSNPVASKSLPGGSTSPGHHSALCNFVLRVIYFERAHEILLT